MEVIFKLTMSVHSASYTDTSGYCRGGKVWPSGSLWDCNYGSLTQPDCELACNTHSECAAYDRISNVHVGECCLFMEGNTGDGNSGRTCTVKQSGIFVIGIAHFGLLYSKYYLSIESFCPMVYLQFNQ